MYKSSGSNSTSKTTYGNTSTTNPFFQSKTDKKGNTTVNFAKGSAGETMYNTVNQNISGLLQNYLNPNINDPQMQAQLNQFNKQQSANLQNQIINPLANNNMIRSSQATNMYNNLSNQAADYTNDLIANARNTYGSMIDQLMGYYMNGYQGAAGEEQTSLNASSGNATTKTTGKAG